jgi:FAD/FMN-containing dehydrogenase
MEHPAVLVVIARPQNVDDVASIVSFCLCHGILFVVRSGGSNLFGRSQVHGALVIDIREFKYCDVDDGKRSARIGGGVLAGKW